VTLQGGKVENFVAEMNTNFAPESSGFASDKNAGANTQVRVIITQYFSE
jgi:hypothetical protein